MFWGSTLVALLMGVIASFVRVKASARPTNAKKILIPPLAMSTGMLQFLVPAFRLTWLEVGEALVVGLIFSIFLIKTSNFEKRDGEVYLSRSKAFFIVVFALLAIRTVMKAFLGDEVNIFATGGLFYLIAWGMIVPWRIAMYQKYKRIATT
ncbi:cytochrome c biogenesis protein CcdC [Exiguobacterium sp. SH3S2]|nr:cytochrome c biogenesis protein CcdC [Exiguobacterium sp. SH4S7]TCI46471.1 cytochrome c biogenesis protein CcdC [Exiguobacterium sp. SH3S3]TCI48655.1 cytochrome c biogenesis protein CcdC [Exiguobacterium sp. SH5S32]TCI55541.1 cytochrome c biogenesis protein CcdC [Exiguobacterium sp. SH1S4]TCI56579.1 cytochrome c biogenesis protein CcdC [Exiguobacterium sp. SH1S21]TCI62112.1 cytochrome c biogenesis protein CcdC [Exiguobacterium sp. SH3S2]TCI65889.1 cytochrome c biogenesis protein CcdC [Exig